MVQCDIRSVPHQRWVEGSNSFFQKVELLNPSSNYRIIAETDTSQLDASQALFFLQDVSKRDVRVK